MNKKLIQDIVTQKVNGYLKNKIQILEGEYPYEEYSTPVVSKNVLRKALEICFEETYNLCEDGKRENTKNS